MKKVIKLKPLDKFWKNLRKQPNHIQLIMAVLSLAAVGALSYLIFSVSYVDKIYPNVSIGSVSFGGLTVDQAKEKLEDLVTESSEPVTLRYEETSQKLTQEEVDWEYDISNTVEALYGLGRTEPSKLSSLAVQLRSVFSKQRVDPAVSYDERILEAAVATFAAAVDSPAVNAQAEYQKDKLVITKEQSGEVINREEIASEIVKAWALFKSNEIEAKRYQDEPEIVLVDEDRLRSTVESLQQRRLKLTWAGGSKNLGVPEITELIDFIGVPSPDTKASQKVLSATFTVDRAKAYLEELSSEVNQPAAEPRLAIRNGSVFIASPGKTGTVINVAVSAGAIVEAITSDEGVSEVELVMNDDEPLITADNLDQLGIRERIGYGETTFTGSPANRRHNISNGVISLQSALIPPGGEFSTVKTLGAVNRSTGYLPELVIKENRTIPEYGGGLCQVSTTLFRSVLNAGLKVTERRNHSYRVSYYEPPVGLDATIYLPKPDFRFVNDTAAYILVQGRVVGDKVIFELWGASDGRSAVVTQPQILSTTPAGDAIYVETDTLPAGEVKQIERPHDGAVTVAYYTVTRNGEVINRQTFRSVYKAWPARFLVGTGQPS